MIGSILGGALALGSSLFGGLSASKAMKSVKSNLEEQQAENQNWYDRRYNEDATQRADAQRILNLTAKNIRDRNRAAAGAAAVMGGTEESVAAAKAANNEALADAVSRIAVAGDKRKDDIENRYRATNAGLNAQLNQMEVNKANAVTQAIGGAASASGEMGNSIDELIDKIKEG